MNHSLILRSGDLEAVVSTLGASLKGLYERTPHGAIPIIWGYEHPEDKKGGQGDVLMPFPSRIKDGRYSFLGHSYQMELNDKEGPNAIHGFVRAIEWDVSTPDQATARFTTRFRAEEFAARGYPFSLDLTVEYHLSASALTCRFEAINVGSQAAPFGAGFHPYFQVGTDKIDEAEALIPARKYVHFENLIPTGRLDPVEQSTVDFRKLRRIGETRFNHCFADLIADSDGMVRAQLRNPATKRTVTLSFNTPLRYLVVYTGDAIPAPYARVALAIEPMTCATDAFNHPDWGLEVLKPNQRLDGSFIISLS